MRDHSASPQTQLQSSGRAVLGSAAKHAGTVKQRSHNSRPTVQSPFATCEAQECQAQPEEIKALSSRKRARCQSAENDCSPLTEVAQVSNRQQHQHALTVGALPNQHMVTLHKPTPQRPNASTPCCFGIVSATQPLQHSHLGSSSLHSAKPSPAVQPAACTVVPSPMGTPAALVDAVTAGKSTVSDPTDEDRASPARQEHSQECKQCQGQSVRLSTSLCICAFLVSRDIAVLIQCTNLQADAAALRPLVCAVLVMSIHAITARQQS